MYTDIYFNSIKSATVSEVPKYRKAGWNLTTGLIFFFPEIHIASIYVSTNKFLGIFF